MSATITRKRVSKELVRANATIGILTNRVCVLSDRLRAERRRQNPIALSEPAAHALEFIPFYPASITSTQLAKRCGLASADDLRRRIIPELKRHNLLHPDTRRGYSRP